MKKHIEYLKYVLEHKKNVFVECWNRGLYLHAFTHDLSKFHPKEFMAYTNWFHGKYGIKCDDIEGNYVEHNMAKTRFKWAWQHHKDKNKHHWNYWSERKLEMPIKYIEQMICDWKAMSRKFGDTARDFYVKNESKMDLDSHARMYLNVEFGVIDETNTIKTSEIKKMFDCEISSLLQIGYGIELINKNKDKRIGYIDYDVPNRFLGSEIIIKSINFDCDHKGKGVYKGEMTEKYTKQFKGSLLIIDDNTQIW